MTSHAESNKRYREKNKEKALAHNIVGHAIRYGILTPKPCEECGNPKAHAHHDDYSKPLEVIWLCPLCHKKKHKLRDQAAGRNEIKPRKKHKPQYRPNTGYMLVLAERKKKHLDTARAMLADGKSYQEIADAIGIGKGTAFKWLNEVNYK